MSNCVFCEILYGTAPAQEVYDGIATLGIVPLNPVTEGHVIFMPRKHVRDALEEPRITAQVMDDVATYAHHVRRTEQHEDFNIITSAGAEATQTVFHLHIHLVPRRAGDDLALPWDEPSRARWETHEEQVSQVRRFMETNHVDGWVPVEDMAFILSGGATDV